MMAVNQQAQHRSPLCINTSHHQASGVTTVSPGRQAILDAHANSQWNAAVYVAVVLLIYALALIIVTVQRVRNERSQVRLTLLYHSFWRRNSSGRQKPPPPEVDEEEAEVIAALPPLHIPDSPSPKEKLEEEESAV